MDQPILLSAGPERCVLATKSFTAKLAVLLMAAYAAHGRLDEARGLVESAADEIQSFLGDGRVDQLRALAARIAGQEHLYVIGRGPSYPMALEAALKIKEVSYLHAEGFAGGELKHGVIALIDDGTPCVVLAPNDETFWSILSGAEEINARGGYIIGISISFAVVYLSRRNEAAILLPWPIAIAIFGLTVLMCVSASVVSIHKATRIDPALVFKN